MDAGELSGKILDAIKLGHDLYLYDHYIIGPDAMQRAREVLIERCNTCSEPDEVAFLRSVLRGLDERPIGVVDGMPLTGFFAPIWSQSTEFSRTRPAARGPKRPGRLGWRSTEPDGSSCKRLLAAARKRVSPEELTVHARPGIKVPIGREPFPAVSCQNGDFRT